MTAVDVRAALPRRAVIDRAWRQIGAGVEVLSSRDGGPLSRTVKRILDPLVFRLRANPDFSSPVVSAEVADAMGDELLDHADTLRACAAWFSVLKAQRRALRITAGNAQELYFTVCFELAVTRGAPATDGADVAASVLRDIHDGRDRHGIEVLDDLLDDQQALAKLDDQVERSWADVQPTNADVAGFFERLRAVHADASTRPERRARQQAWESLVAEDAPHELGVRVRRTTGVVPWTVSDLGLCAEAPQQRPPVVAAAGRPLDRGVVDRVRATLRRSRDRDDLPVVPMLCAEEADRACAPWGLMAEDLQATLVNGIVVAVQLKPLDPRTEPDTPFAATIQAKLRKEAYVLHARRLLADVTALHPRQRQVVDDLDAFARPYLGRLWARLHGRDVWQESCSDVEDVRSLLTGIARSVSLDHRQRIKAMLEPEAAA
ncbi:hypothetical protein [Nocardioides alcanivorans]|uniref:hypothetical protein n=1 Tax=Nocardioides alcanivorans TaxID=2897352 RepID=UPI001F1FB949|nr:hypothetical protein [Nocardioides alcanivorans]